MTTLQNLVQNFIGAVQKETAIFALPPKHDRTREHPKK